MLADEQTSPEQFAVLRTMTGERRLKVAERLYWSARKWKSYVGASRFIQDFE